MGRHDECEERRAPRLLDPRSPVATVGALIGKYVMPAGKPLYEVAHIYGPRIIGRLIDDQGEASTNLTVIDFADGLEFMDLIPDGYLRDEPEETSEPATPQERKRRGPQGWEVLNFLYVNAGQSFTIRQISAALGYGGEANCALAKGRMGGRFHKQFGDLLSRDTTSGKEHRFEIDSDASATEILKRIVLLTPGGSAS